MRIIVFSILSSTFSGTYRDDVSIIVLMFRSTHSTQQLLTQFLTFKNEPLIEPTRRTLQKTGTPYEATYKTGWPHDTDQNTYLRPPERVGVRQSDHSLVSL